jgi:hypothetical protein
MRLQADCCFALLKKLEAEPLLGLSAAAARPHAAHARRLTHAGANRVRAVNRRI